MLFAGIYEPVGWKHFKGQMLDPETYGILFSVIADSGGGQAHPNEQPYMAINYLIYFLP